MKGKKGKWSNSNYDVVSLLNLVSSLTQVRLITSFLQHERRKQSNFSLTTRSILIIGKELVV